MVKIFLEARRLYKKLISLQMKIADNEIEDADGYLHLFKDLLNKFEKVLNKVDIYKLDVDPSYIKTLEKEYSTMVEDAAALNWQYKYWLYRTPLMKRTRWIASLINNALRKEHQKGESKNSNKSIYDVPTVTVKDVEEFLETMLSMDMLENYEGDIKRLIRGTYTEPGLYRLWISYKRSDYSNSSNNHAFVKPNNIIEDNVNLSTKIIKDIDNKFISDDEFRLKLYPILIKNGWKWVNKFSDKYPTDKKFKSFYKKLVNDNNSVRVLINDNLNYMLLTIRDVEVSGKELLIKFIDYNNPVDYTKLKEDIDDKLYNTVNESTEFKRPENIINNNLNLTVLKNLLFKYKPEKNNFFGEDKDIIAQILNNGDFKFDDNFSDDKLYDNNLLDYINTGKTNASIKDSELYPYLNKETGKGFLILFYTRSSGEIVSESIVPIYIKDNILYLDESVINESTEFKRPENIVGDNVEINKIINDLKPYLNRPIKYNYEEQSGESDKFYELLDKYFNSDSGIYHHGFKHPRYSNDNAYKKEPFKSFIQYIIDKGNILETNNNFAPKFFMIFDSKIYGDKIQFVVYSFVDKTTHDDYVAGQLIDNTKTKINEGFENPFVSNEENNDEDTELINKPKPKNNNLITKVELWDSNRRLNQIKCLRNKVIANTKFFKGDIVEAAPVITLSHEDLYSKNIRDIVFDISPGKFGIPLGYSSIYRTSADTRNEPNIDYKYDIENNELIFVATKNIDKGEELIIAVDDTVYDNQLTEESFADMFSPSTYEPTENGILGIKALSEPNSPYNPGVSGIAPTSGGL